MSIELRIADEDMTDLSGDVEPVDEPVADPVPQPEANSNADPVATDELLLKVQQLKRFYDIPVDLDPSKKWHDDIRLNVLHVNGVQDMGSEDLLAYFKAFDPSSLEWVNDTSCNVVFDDALTAARAIAKLATHRIGDAASDACNESLALFPLIRSDSLKSAPPDGQWLLGSEHEKSKQLLIRFAKPDDKKKSGAGKFSEYYRKYGNPHYGGKKQLMSGSLAEKLKNMTEMEGGLDEDDDEAEDENETAAFSSKERRSVSPARRPAGLKMKMRADEEEEKNGRGRSFDKFANEREKKSVWDRLEKPSVLDRIGSSSRVIQRKRTTGSDSSSSSSLSVWSRLSLTGSSSKKEANKRNVLYSNIRIKK